MLSTDWLTRIRSFGLGGAREAASPSLAPVVRSAPGLASLFESLEDGRGHAVLDLGAACDASLSVYSRFARQVRFADLSATPSGYRHWDFALAEVGRAAVDPHDVLLIWDTLGHMPREERSRVVACLAELASPAARLHMVMEAPERSGPRPVRFSVADTKHMRHELTRDDTAAPPWLFLPSDMDRMLAPFHVVRAFTLKDGLREYVAVRRQYATGSAR